MHVFSIPNIHAFYILVFSLYRIKEKEIEDKQKAALAQATYDARLSENVKSEDLGFLQKPAEDMKSSSTPKATDCTLQTSNAQQKELTTLITTKPSSSSATDLQIKIQPGKQPQIVNKNIDLTIPSKRQEKSASQVPAQLSVSPKSKTAAPIIDPAVDHKPTFSLDNSSSGVRESFSNLPTTEQKVSTDSSHQISSTSDNVAKKTESTKPASPKTIGAAEIP